jgi:hypothetical protein
MIGPLKLKYSRHNANIEALCHLCSWVDFKPTEQKARDALLRHLDSKHWNPREHIFDVKRAPGYGGAAE